MFRTLIVILSLVLDLHNFRDSGRHESANAQNARNRGRCPDFKLPGVDGKDNTLASFKDAKLLCIIFTCNHCPTAQAYEERIKKLHADYKDRGVALVAISPNDDLAVRSTNLATQTLNDSFADMKYRAKTRVVYVPVPLMTARLRPRARLRRRRHAAGFSL